MISPEPNGAPGGIKIPQTFLMTCANPALDLSLSEERAIHVAKALGRKIREESHKKFNRVLAEIVTGDITKEEYEKHASQESVIPNSGVVMQVHFKWKGRVILIFQFKYAHSEKETLQKESGEEEDPS